MNRAAESIHYSFVVDERGHSGYQAYLLARSLIELGRVAPESITACLVSGADPATETVLRELGLTPIWVEPVTHPYNNRLQQLPVLAEIPADTYVLLDADMFCLRPLEFASLGAAMGRSSSATASAKPN